MHSPAPLSTAPPAGTGRPNASSAEPSRTVTPVRATPRPAGGSGSSRQTRGVPEPDPGDVEDGVGRPGRQRPDPDPEVSSARHAWHPAVRRPADGMLAWRSPRGVVAGLPAARPAGARSGSACAPPGTEVRRAGDASSARRCSRPGRRLVDARRRTTTRVLRRVHDPALLDHLRTRATTTGSAAGFPTDPGQDRVVPYVFPTAALLGGLPLREPTAVHARAGRYCYDTMTLVGPGHLGGGARRGRRRADRGRPGGGRRARVAYALCRPPGPPRDAGTAFGGSCYLNNAAVAAAGAARRRGTSGSRSSTSTRTTATARRRCSTTAPTSSTARCTSTPAPAGSRTTSGFADETGRGAGAGANLNVPLAAGHRRRRRGSTAVDRLRRRGRGARRDRAGGLAGRRRRRRRPGEPAAGHRTTATARAGALLGARSGCRPSRCRRAATTCPRSARSSWPPWRGCPD